MRHHCRVQTELPDSGFGFTGARVGEFSQLFGKPDLPRFDLRETGGFGNQSTDSLDRLVFLSVSDRLIGRQFCIDLLVFQIFKHRLPTLEILGYLVDRTAVAGDAFLG